MRCASSPELLSPLVWCLLSVILSAAGSEDAASAETRPEVSCTWQEQYSLLLSTHSATKPLHNCALLYVSTRQYSRIAGPGSSFSPSHAQYPDPLDFLCLQTDRAASMQLMHPQGFQRCRFPAHEPHVAHKHTQVVYSTHPLFLFDWENKKSIERHT